MAKNHGVLFDKNMWKHINKLGYYPVEVMDNQQDLVDVVDRIIPILNIKG
jgi:spore coat protein CotF